MGWLKNMSLKKSFFVIITASLTVAILSGIIASMLCNVLIDFFHLYVTVPVSNAATENMAAVITAEGTLEPAYYYTYTVEPGYTILITLQVILPILFVIAALLYADIFFYRLKLKHPIELLQDSAERIQRQDLDFTITGYASDELGRLCSAFEIMRKTLLSNNQELWRQGEERKRLNAAFSHDLRNPVTVLKGSAKLLQKGITNGTLTADNAAESVDLICQYAGRIEQYIESMTRAQKLEELECKPHTYDSVSIHSELQNSLTILGQDSGKEITFLSSGTATQVHIDKQFVYNTAENLVGNALRYAKSKVTADITYEQNQLVLCVTDDGNGFPPATLKKGIVPFSRKEAPDSQHFGMGLYICKLLCQKHGGDLTLENLNPGARVTATFHF